MARREFAQGKALFCQVEVYGAQKDGSGMPQVAMGYVVRQADGSVFTRVDPAVDPSHVPGQALARSSVWACRRLRPGTTSW